VEQSVIRRSLGISGNNSTIQPRKARTISTICRLEDIVAFHLTEDARERFKEYVRVLCSIKESEADKLLVLKSRFLADSDLPYDATSSELRRKASQSSAGEPQL
jgi:hypothetical protein